MNKRKKNREHAQSRPDPASTPSCNQQPFEGFGWSPACRAIASLVIVAYLGIVLLGPLSNPIGSPNLTQPLANFVSPIHQALYHGHGYRFFGPDPSATHRVVVKGVQQDGTGFEAAFPDRKQHWPRLLYHRWFMLSETMFHEFSITPNQTAFQERLKNYDREIARFQEQNKPSLSQQLQHERAVEVELYQISRERFNSLAGSVARVLAQRHKAKTIELFIQERTLPFPEEVVSGMKLGDDEFLSERIKIGSWSEASGFEPFVAEEISPGAAVGGRP